MTQTPLEYFEKNLADAYMLVELAEALDNLRTRRMRRELREKAGVLIGASARDVDLIDCIESDDFFLILKPGTDWRREHLQDRRPLLRQAVVAGAAAFESFLGDRVTADVRNIIGRRGDLPPRLASVPLDLNCWDEVESYKYRRRGITEVVLDPHIHREASTASNKVGVLLAMLDISSPLKKIDVQRGLASGTTDAELMSITARRNKIAHLADRQGRGRANITSVEVREMLDTIDETAQAIDVIIDKERRAVETVRSR